MTITAGSGQGSGGKGLTITAITAGAAQTLHTAVAGTASTQVVNFLFVNNSAAGVTINIQFVPDDASPTITITESIPAQSSWDVVMPKGIPVNDTMVVSVFASEASAITAWATIDDQSGVSANIIRLDTGHIDLVQNANAFRMNGLVSSTTETNHQIMIPVAGTLTNLRARALANLGGGAEATITVRVNVADSALSVTIAVAETTVIQTDSDSVAVSAGDLVTINAATDNAGAPATDVFCSVDFIAD